MPCNSLRCTLTVQCRGILWAVNTVELCSLCLGPGVLWECNVTAVLTLRCAVFAPGCAVFELSDHLLCTRVCWREYNVNILPAPVYCRPVLCNIQFLFLFRAPLLVFCWFSSFLSLQALIVPELFSVIFDQYFTSASGVISWLWSSRNKIYETCLVCLNLPYLDMEILYYWNGLRTRSLLHHVMEAALL